LRHREELARELTRVLPASASRALKAESGASAVENLTLNGQTSWEMCRQTVLRSRSAAVREL